MKNKTDQEDFWEGEFGNEYITRNESLQQLASGISFFAKCFRTIRTPNSIIEFGSNIGVNLKAIKFLFPKIKLSAIEINVNAVKKLQEIVDSKNIYNQSILSFNSSKKHDLVLIKGVLIHINPDMLNYVYEKLYKAISKYILIAEYYSPTPVSIDYRGHKGKLFKRDFAGEIMRKYIDLKLVDYGFVWKGDPTFPQDDITWFLFEKELEK
jgi:pseudaminic acid biosynthesis-associated methylase